VRLRSVALDDPSIDAEASFEHAADRARPDPRCDRAGATARVPLHHRVGTA